MAPIQFRRFATSSPSPSRTQRRVRRVAVAGGVAALALLGALAWPRTARADVVIYGPAPAPPRYYAPPPPPPPRYYAPAPPPPGYYYGPPPRRYYYDDREPPYALQLGVDLEGAIPLNVPRFLDGNNLEGGGGIKLRVGEQIRLHGGVRFTFEGGYGFDHLFANDDLGNNYSWDLHRLFGGARLAFGRFVVPVVYAHVGYGWRTTGDPTVPGAGGLAFDVGGALDFRVIPHVVFGGYVEYASIDAQPFAPEWLALGGHVELLF